MAKIESNSDYVFGSLVSDWNNMKKDLQDKLIEESKDYFLEEFDNQRWDGVDWPELNEKYLKWKTDKGFPSTKLVMNKGLRTAVANPLITKISNLEFEIKIDHELADYHNFGTSVIPRRQFIGQTKNLEIIQTDIIYEAMKKTLKK